MTTLHVLVDFENTQPTAEEVSAARRDDLRLWIFRGPSQKKYNADFAEALMGHGERVQVVRCEKSGRNALDMHIALQLGRLVGVPGSAPADASFVVVSRDTDYEPVLLYLRTLGYAARRVANLKAALAGSAAPAANGKPGAKVAARTASRTSATRAAPAAKTHEAAKTPAARTPAPRTPAAAKAPAARAAGRSSEAKPAVTRTARTSPQSEARAAPAPAARAAHRQAAEAPARAARTAALVSAPAGRPAAKPAARAEAVQAAAAPVAAGRTAPSIDALAEHLRRHPRSRPARLSALKAWLVSRKVPQSDAAAVVDALAARGALRVTGTKVDYPG